MYYTSLVQLLHRIYTQAGSRCILFPIYMTLPTGRRVLVTILEEEPIIPIDEVTLLSEAALAEDWNRPEEDAAGSHQQPVP